MSQTGSFPTTQWTDVRYASQDGAALSQLVTRYLRPLRAHLVLRRRLPSDRADELLQGFVADKVLERNLVGHAQPARGRFRTFLLVALDRYVSNQLRNERCAVRRTQGVSELDALDIADDAMGPSEVFELVWARQVLSDAAGQMLRDCRSAGREDVWGVFDARVLAPTLEGTEPVEYEELTRRYDLDGVEAARNLLVTGKRMFARSVRGVIREYTGDDSLIEQELAELRQLLAGARK